MTILKAAGLFGNHKQSIDHMGPLCSLLKIPLFTNDLKTKLIFERTYIDIDVHLHKMDLESLFRDYDYFFYAFEPVPRFRELIEQSKKKDHYNSIWRKPIKLVFNLHGCSDKGYKNPLWFGGPKGHLSETDLILLYGQRMFDLFEERGYTKHFLNYTFIGNYRFQYYRKHQEYFDSLVYDDIFKHFTKQQPTIFYAPTWKDNENASSFFEASNYLLKYMPKHYNLLVKLHPHLTAIGNNYDPTPIFELIDQYKNSPNILILHDYPLIYPLLNAIDIYLGDASSIGYDCLAFNKPMFFLNHNQHDIEQNKSIYLHRCGTSILPADFQSIYQIIDQSLLHDFENFNRIRKETYGYAFHSQDSEDIKKSILKAFNMTTGE